MLAGAPLASAPLAATAGLPPIEIVDGFAMGDAAPPPQLTLVDALALADAGTHGVRAFLQVIEACVFASQHVQVATQGFTVNDGFSLQDAAAVVYKLMGTDSVSLESIATERARQTIAVVDFLLAAGIATSKLTAIEQVASALAAADAAEFVAREEGMDEMAIAAIVVNALRAYQEAISALVAEDTATMRVRFVTFVDDSVKIADSQTNTGKLLQLINDGVGFAVDLAIEDGRYIAWVVNANTRAAWSYSNFGFNSFAQLADGDYFGAKEDGIYLLDGEDDAGDAIRATLRTGFFDFGSPNVKRLPTIYVAARRDGELVFKVILETEEGATEAHWYMLKGGVAPRTRQDRVDRLDKGLEAMEFAFELVNVDGADFDIESMQLLPLITSRRI